VWEAVAALWLGSLGLGNWTRRKREAREVERLRKRYGCDTPGEEP
jgi:hypothetical protein